MTEGSPIRLILGIALPLMLGNVFQQMYTVVDTMVVGKGVGMDALAALGSSDWFNWLFLGVVQGFAQGFAIPMAQAFGANDHDDLRRFVGNSVILAALTSLVITAIALFTLRPVLNLLGTPAEIQPMAISYLTVLFAALPVVMAYNLLAGILRSLGDGKSPLYAMVIASFVNIALDLLFVIGFGRGVVGAAAATVIAQVCSCIFCLYRLKGIAFMRLSKRDFGFDSTRCAKLMKLGLPLSMQNCIIAVGGMIVQSVVNPLGVTFIAGYTATNKLYGLLEIAAVSYGYAMSAYCGQNLGAKKTGRIRRGVRAGAVAGVITAGVIAAFMFLFGRGIVSLFIDSAEANAAEAIDIAVQYLRLMSAALPVLYILHVYRSSLQGMGDTVMPMVSGFAEFVMRTGAALLLPGLIGYWGVFWAEVLAWAGADLILVPAYWAGFAKVRKLYGEEN